ncbi:MAG TPA: PTS sugar transporter subunit IIA [Tepidisphaeraceae bacterium]|nr:PTS sugar transporter subunit IIA [Tepidisphaeraceae bacterium]
MAEDRASTFLQMIRRSSRGRLKIYLGYGPGVGKTYQMLQEARRLKDEGIDVVVGIVETHGRKETAALLEGLDLVPRRKMEYHGIIIEEMDVDALLARKPTVAVVDELAHTNAPDSRNPKRYQDVQELLAAGIHVISTLNVQHLESLYNTVEKLLGVKVRERLPDSVLAEADQVVNVDLAAEDLQKRLREGKVYPKDRALSALENFFTQSNLEHLRELTLREVASQLDFRRREQKTDGEGARAGGADQVMVCLSSRGPNSAKLLRYGSRLAGRLNRNWYALYVQTPKEDPTAIDARVQRLLYDTLTLANQLGATVFQFKGQNVADTIMRFAREYRVGNIVIGKPRPMKWWQRMLGKTSVAEELITIANGPTVIVVDAEAEPSPTAEMPLESEPKRVAAGGTAPPPSGISAMLSPDQIVIWEEPVSKAQIFETLANRITGGEMTLAQRIVGKLQEREKTGSTFLNEGVALPHARVDDLDKPRIALGITRNGVLDAPTEKPIEIVFMLVTPASGPSAHLQLLAKASRLLQGRELRRRLLKANTPAEALEELAFAESSPAPVK